MTGIKNFFSWKRAPAALPEARIAGDGPEKANPWTGLRDAAMRGWFNQETGELFPGVPIGPDDVVADIGCGDGGYAQFCASRGAKLLLADVDAECLAATAARINALPDHQPFESHLTNSDPLPIADATATRVVCTEVIEHVASPTRLLAELARIGQSGAIYLISCPDPNSEAIQKRIAHPAYFEAPNHIRIIGKDQLAGWVEDAGLIIERRDSHGFYQSIWWSLFWACDVTFQAPDHPILNHWNHCWSALLQTENGPMIKNALDDLLPKSQIIIARKP